MMVTVKMVKFGSAATTGIEILTFTNVWLRFFLLIYLYAYFTDIDMWQIVYLESNQGLLYVIGHYTIHPPFGILPFSSQLSAGCH